MLRRRAQLLFICIGSVLVGGATFAQVPEPTLGQLAHRVWTAQDEAPGGISALAQTGDGFLWLGGASGLFRFDGVRFERYEPPAGQVLPSTGVNALLAAPDGALWVGYRIGGASVITRGHLVNFGTADGLPGGVLSAFALDSTGHLWGATSRGLAYFQGSRWHVVDTAWGYPGGFTNELLVDRRGTLWVDAPTGLYTLPRGGHRFTRSHPPSSADPDDIGAGGIQEAPSGEVWAVSIRNGLSRLTDSGGRLVPDQPFYDLDRGRQRGWGNAVIDRQGYAWGKYTIGRLVRVVLAEGGKSRAMAPVQWDALEFSPKMGNSGSTPLALLEDREGTIWVSTDGGLDQYRTPKFRATTWPFPYEPPNIAAADDGAMWAGSGLDQIRRIDADNTMHAAFPTRITASSRDLVGDVWVGGQSGVWRYSAGRFEQIALPPELNQCTMLAIAHSRDGTLWVSCQRRGVFRRRGDTWELFGAPGSSAVTITSDSAGSTWLGYLDGRLVREDQGNTREYGAAEGLNVGSVLTVTVAGDRVWIGGDLGVAILDARAEGSGNRKVLGRFSPLIASKERLRSVSGIVVTDDAVWLRDADGVARVQETEVTRALGERAYLVRAERFDARDRVDGPTYFLGPTAVLGTDKRLWVSWIGGLGWIDPAHIHRNTIPPPVMVRALTAAGRTYADTNSVQLPKRTSAFSIAYTALSLAVPERVRFRYRLLGLDTTWQDAGARREAFYTNLAPGAYRFEVTAANDDGVWSVAPAAVDVVIPPAFVQTGTFRALCGFGVAGTLWLLMLWRQRRVATAIRMRFDATLAERTRVARELHDTLLTDVAGIRMRLEAVARVLGPTGVGATIADIRDQASEALISARRAVVEMRTPADVTRPVHDQLAEAARRIFGETSITSRVTPSGEPRRYAIPVETAALRIGVEAMTNARKHADCHEVVVHCAYSEHALRLEIRDDGRGFEPQLGVTSGHYGLVGLRERAGAIGAHLTIESVPGSGTTIRVVIPAGGTM